jgi:hypothetical protein
MSTLLTLPAAASKTSSQAVWSLVLGILSITCLWLLGSIPAVILGVLAVRNIDRSGGTLQGRGLGIAGIVTGSVGVLAGIGSVAMMSALMIPSFSGARIAAQRAREMSQIQQISLACTQYANEHNGAFPETLPQLVEDGLIDEDTLQPKQALGVGFLYRPGLNMTTSIPEPFLASPVPIGGQRVVGKTDGVVELIGEEVFQSEHAGAFP